MKKVSFKKYIYLIAIVVVTVIITLIASNIYKNSKSVETDFYKYSNTISSKEFDLYMTENPDSIIYIYDKYNNKYNELEVALKDRIEELYLKNIFIYIDKRELNKKFISSIKENYGVEIKYNNKPIIIIISDKNVVSVIELDDESYIDSVNLGVFE